MKSPSSDLLLAVNGQTRGFSAGAFDHVRRELIAETEKLGKNSLSEEEVLAVIEDILMAEIGKVRRVQSLYAMLNCTRKSLLPALTDPIEKRKEEWIAELGLLGENLN